MTSAHMFPFFGGKVPYHDVRRASLAGLLGVAFDQLSGFSVSIHWGPLCGSHIIVRALLFGVYIEAPDFGKFSLGHWWALLASPVHPKEASATKKATMGPNNY